MVDNAGNDPATSRKIQPLNLTSEKFSQSRTLGQKNQKFSAKTLLYKIFIYKRSLIVTVGR